MNELERGRDAVSIEVEPDALVVAWSDGSETRTESDDLRTRIRAQSFSVKALMKRKGRLSWQRRI